MDNVTFIEIENLDGSKQSHAIIENSDGSFTSMPKEVWDEQQKAAELGGTL